MSANRFITESYGNLDNWLSVSYVLQSIKKSTVYQSKFKRICNIYRCMFEQASSKERERKSINVFIEEIDGIVHNNFGKDLKK